MGTKRTERKTQKGLPRATFGSSLQKRKSGAKGVLKVKIGKPRRNRIPSDDEEAPACWSDISPSIPSSPEVEQLVDKVNEEYTASMAADTPSDTPPPLARPRVPTAAVKCPRKEFRATQRPKEHKEPRKPKARKIRLTALQEIRRYQSGFEDVLPFAPFARLVREICSGLRAMRFTKEALQALRSGAEAYLLEVLEKANLACGHAGRCTLKDKDIHLVRRVLDHDISMGCTEASIQAWQKDLLKERAKRITYKEAQTKEACWRQKLQDLARMKRAAYRRNAQHRK